MVCVIIFINYSVNLKSNKRYFIYSKLSNYSKTFKLIRNKIFHNIEIYLEVKIRKANLGYSFSSINFVTLQ